MVEGKGQRGAKALFLQVCLVFLIEINWTVLKTDSFHHTVAFHIYIYYMYNVLEVKFEPEEKINN